MGLKISSSLINALNLVCVRLENEAEISQRFKNH